MKFYQVSDSRGGVIACETSLKAACARGRKQCPGAYDVDVIVTPAPSRELVRILLAEQGGYAIESHRIIENGKPYHDSSATQEDAE